MKWFGSYLGDWLGGGEPSPPGTLHAVLQGSGQLTGTLVGDSGEVGGLKYWDGSTWTMKPIKYWNGADWVVKPLKRWNGSIWV